MGPHRELGSQDGSFDASGCSIDHAHKNRTQTAEKWAQTKDKKCGKQTSDFYRLHFCVFIEHMT